MIYIQYSICSIYIGFHTSGVSSDLRVEHPLKCGECIIWQPIYIISPAMRWPSAALFQGLLYLSIPSSVEAIHISCIFLPLGSGFNGWGFMRESHRSSRCDSYQYLVFLSLNPVEIMEKGEDQLVSISHWFFVGIIGIDFASWVVVPLSCHGWDALEIVVHNIVSALQGILCVYH